MRSETMTQATGPGAGGEQPFEDTGPRSGPPDALVLDIGGDIGALVIYADETCLGSEIDLTPAGAPRSHHVHTMIRRRRATNRDIIAGLWPELREGTYTVWGLDDSGPIGQVTIVGAQVSEFHGGNCRGEETRTEAGNENESEHPHSHPLLPTFRGNAGA
jgi:hypothetical protein